MRTAHWLLTPMFALALGCGDDGSDTETDATTNPSTTNTTPGDSTTNDTTTNPTTEDPTTGTPTTVDPTTEDPTTGSPTTGDPTTGDPTTGDMTTGEPVELTCNQYCTLYESGCQDFAEYDNTAECLAQCKQWPIGVANETAGDSLGCRLYHVGVANMVDPMVHCPHAGPSGAGTCVNPDAPTCADYCATYLANCKDDLNLYTDEADCLDQCSEWYPGKDATETSGDTIGCRTYHAGVALGEPMTHCPHAGPGGAMVCVTP